MAVWAPAWVCQCLQANWTQGHWFVLWFHFKLTISKFPISSQHWQRVLPYFFTKLALPFSDMTHVTVSVQILLPSTCLYSANNCASFFTWKNWNILLTPWRPLSFLNPHSAVPLLDPLIKLRNAPSSQQRKWTHSLDLFPSYLLKDFNLPAIFSVSLSTGPFHQTVNTSPNWTSYAPVMHSSTDIFPGHCLSSSQLITICDPHPIL